MGRSARILRLTQREVDGLKPARKRYYLWLNEPRGFGISVQPGGMKTYVLRYTTAEQRERFHTLGATDRMTLAEARTQAAIRVGEVVQGGDPSAQRVLERADARGKRMPFGEFWAIYLDDARSRLKPRTLRDLEGIWERHLRREFGSVALADMNRQAIAAMHRRMAATPTRANRTLAHLRAALSRAIEWGLFEGDGNPAAGIRMYPERRREFRFEPEQWGSYLRAVDGLERDATLPSVRDAGGRYTSASRGCSPFIAGFLRVMAFTGMRRGEGLGLRWAEVNFDLGLFELTDSKTGPRVVFCGRAAMEELRRLHGLRTQETWVFEGSRSGQPFTEPKAILNRLAQLGGLPDFSLHGIRHAVASHLAELGFPESPVIQGILGHRQRTVTGRYVHAARVLFQEAVQAHEDALLAYRDQRTAKIEDVEAPKGRRKVSAARSR
jgi:integrase